MIDKVKQTISFLLQPKAIFLGVAIFLLIYITDIESRVQEIVGCYDCGWNMRQALFLLIAAVGLLLGRFWSVIIALLASLKVIYSIGYISFWNTNLAEVYSGWRILRESLAYTYESHPERFVEIIVALLITMYGVSFLWRRISRRYLFKTNSI